MKCEKCGGIILGPTYSETGINPAYQKECLIYHCLQCGFRFATPTNDQLKNNAKMQEIRDLIDKEAQK